MNQWKEGGERRGKYTGAIGSTYSDSKMMGGGQSRLDLDQISTTSTSAGYKILKILTVDENKSNFEINLQEQLQHSIGCGFWNVFLVCERNLKIDSWPGISKILLSFHLAGKTQGEEEKLQHLVLQQKKG